LQALRNCSGKGPPARIELNGSFYSRCPRAINMENGGARYLVNLFFDCRRLNIYPYPGGPTAQTAFCMELFSFLEGIVTETQRRADEAAKAANKSP
jgi:hypothetical protein